MGTVVPSFGNFDLDFRGGMAQKNSMKSFLGVGSLAAAAAAFVYFIIRSFSGPLLGQGDVETNEAIGFLFAKLVRFNPLPALSPQTDWIGFPHGVPAFAQVWCLEKEYLTLWLNTVFGSGPWIQGYVVFSFVVAAVGATWLLRKEFAFRESLIAGFCLSFLNFYSIHKYPGHTNFVIVHWTSLNLVCDFVICRQLNRGIFPSLRMALLRALLLVLALGQDLGTVAGFALLSFTFMTMYALKTGRQLFSIADWTEELGTNRAAISGLGVLLTVVTYLYVPIIWQLSRLFAAQPLAETGTYWANPLRLLLPWFPGLNPSSLWVDATLNDKPEGLGALSPGWTLLIVGCLGIKTAWRRKLGYALPLILIFLLIITYQPKIFPTLKIFPWFEHLRVSGRCSIVLSTLLTCLGLIYFDSASETRKRFAASGLGVLLLVEWFTAYSWLPVPQVPPLSTEYLAYAKEIQLTPGAAVLDWPFCLHSGDGRIPGLCADPESLEPVYTRQRFFNKKTVGMYLGRSQREWVRPFYEEGWNFIFRRLAKAPKDGVCLTKAEQEFFVHFFQRHDFAGVNLYRDFLPDSCAEDFRMLFGEPSTMVYDPVLRAVEFYPRPPAWTSAIIETKPLRYRPAIKKAAFDFSRTDTLEPIDFEGLEPRQAEWLVISAQPSITFSLPNPRTVTLTLRVRSELADQTLTVLFNGKTIADQLALPVTAREIKATLSALAGDNRLELQMARSGDWRDIIGKYRTEFGNFALLNVLKLQKYYNRHRRQAAVIDELVIEEGRP